MGLIIRRQLITSNYLTSEEDSQSIYDCMLSRNYANERISNLDAGRKEIQ